MQTELRGAARKGCTPEAIRGAVGLIGHLGKACFLQGLSSERIQTIVRSRGKSITLSQAVELSLEEECAIFSNREKSMAEGHIRCTNCNRIGHTAGKCKVRFSPAVARAERSVMNVISCYNCGRLGHVAREYRQRPSNELCEPRSRTDFGRQGTSLVIRGPAVPRGLDYVGQESRANFRRQETSVDNREPSSTARNARSVQKRNWTHSGNGSSRPACNPSTPRTRRY